MASLRIHDENAVHGRGKGQEGLIMPKQRRPVLGASNTNVENIKNIAQLDKPILKPNAATKNIKNVLSSKVHQQSQPFSIFRDESSTDPHPKPPAVALNNITKARALKEKKIEVVESKVEVGAVSTHADYLQACLRFNANIPVPMSPASDVDSPMCMDVSLKKPEFKSFDAATAQTDLDCLTLTERLYMCEEYRDDISIYLRSLQECYKPRKNYMSRQQDITYHMRAVLIDWLVEVTDEYKLHNETLYLAVSYIDRFLSQMSVVRNKLQLVGTAAMFIAAKYEEIYPPDVKDFVYITDDTYTKKQVLRMEHLILRILEFNLSAPTPVNFLALYTSHFPTPDNVKYLAMYLCELSLVQGDPYLGLLPSDIAAAALCVARATILPEEEVLPDELNQQMDVQLRDIIFVVEALEGTFRVAETCQQQAIREKYKHDKYLKVACIPPPHVDCSSILSKSLTPSPERPKHAGPTSS